MPELYEQFGKNGNFVIKKSSVSFTSVAVDPALEQSINRSQKSSKGIIGCTQQMQFVTAWNLTHHEMMDANNLYRTITNVKFENDELRTHQDFGVTMTERSEGEVDKLMQYLLARDGDPFKSVSHPLKNFATQELATSKACETLLNVFDIACEKLNSFTRERFDEKKLSPSDTISEFKLPHFKTVQVQKSAKNSSSTKKKKK